MTAKEPLVYYVSAGGPLANAKWIDVLIQLPGDVEDYFYSTTGDVPFTQVPTPDADAIDLAGGTGNGDQFIFSIQAQDFNERNGKIIYLSNSANPEDEDVTSLTIYFKDYNTSSDPMEPIYEALHHADATKHAQIHDVIMRLTESTVEDIVDNLRRRGGEEALKKFERYYNRAIIAAGDGADPVATHIKFWPDAKFLAPANENNVSVTGAKLYAENGEDAEVWFSEPATDATLSGEVGNREYNRRSAVKVDINVHARLDDDTTREITELTVPLVVTMPIPKGFDHDDLLILYYGNKRTGRPEVIEPISTSRNGVTFLVEQPGLFVFAEETTERDDDYDYDYDDDYDYIPTPSNTYPVISHPGMWDGYGNVTGTINAPANRFLSVRYVEGRATLNANHYSVTSYNGGTNITFYESFLRTLPSGTHTFRVQFTNGGYADLSIRVLYAGVPDYNVTNPPKTGDASAGIWGAWMIAAALGAGIVVWKKRRA